MERGFLLVDDMLVGGELAAAQAAYNRQMEPARAQWMDALARGVQQGDQFEGKEVVIAAVIAVSSFYPCDVVIDSRELETTVIPNLEICIVGER